MPFDQRALAQLSARFRGVVDLHQLRLLGATHHQVKGLIRTGRYDRVGIGLYRSTEHPHSPEQDALIACKLTGGATSHGTASWLSGLRGVPRPELPHVTVHHRHRLALGPFILHRSTLLPADHLVHRRDGIVTTSPCRTAFDLVSIIGLDRTESIVEQLLDERKCTLPGLRRVAAQMRAQGRAGSAAFTEVLDRRPAWARPVDSDLELRLVKALMSRGVAEPVRQHPIELPGGKIVHPDLAWPAQRFAVEVNHVTWHGRAEQSRYDAWRYRQLRLLGWHVEPVSDTDISVRLESTCTELAELLARRPAEPRDIRGAA